MPEEQQQVSIGVTFAPLVTSIKEAKVGETISLQLISGLTPEGIVWKSGETIVPTALNYTVTFTEPGVYIPVILTFPQHISYAITVTNE